MKEKKIAIVGHGFVGKATESIVKENVVKKIIDPKYNTNIKDLEGFNPEFVFVCVPTPMGNSGQNGKIIEQVIDEISNLEIQPTIVIKSTVIPNILENISKKITNVVYNPEFLREKHAHEDFVNSSFIILGGENPNLEKVKIFYEENTICKTNNFIFTDLFRASLAKYTINSFLASKVLFFNTINELFIKENYSNKEWKDFIEIIANDERVGSSHMDVPGHDGRKGFGGACFPKDIDALIKFGNLKNVDLSLLKTIQSLNNEIRSQYKVETEREIEQDIEFN